MKIAAAQTMVSRDIAANGATIRQTLSDAAAQGDSYREQLVDDPRRLDRSGY